jgi:short-subunit dehydrogenase
VHDQTPSRLLSPQHDKEKAMAITDLKTKHVLVTGAGAGIGRETALAFARQGANILATDINAQSLVRLKQEVERYGVNCHTWVVNVADADAMQAFAAEVHHMVGAVDVLVNNAGIASLGKFLESDLAHWRRVLDVNVMGMVHGCHFFISPMIKAGGVRQVVNVASAAAYAPACAMAAYAASKSAAMGFSEVLMMELSDTTVGVTIVCPGIINTDITQRTNNVSASITDTQLGRLQDYYVRNGILPDVVGEAIVDAVRARRDLLMVGPYAKLTFYVKRLSRRLLRKLIIQDSKKMGFI